MLGAFLIISGLDILKIENLTIKPGKKTWVVGLVTVGIGIVFLWMDSGSPFPFSPSTGTTDGASNSSESDSTEPAEVAADSESGINSDSCFGEFFEGVPEDRITILEVGVRDFTVIESEETKSETFGLQLAENGNLIGALKVNFINNGELFNIEGIVDNTCTKIRYENLDFPGDAVLQNWNTIEFKILEETYVLRLGYDGVTISANRFTKATE